MLKWLNLTLLKRLTKSTVNCKRLVFTPNAYPQFYGRTHMVKIGSRLALSATAHSDVPQGYINGFIAYANNLLQAFEPPLLYLDDIKQGTPETIGTSCNDK